MDAHLSANGLGTELRLILQRGRQAWRLVPVRHKAALGIAALIMALTGLCNTSVPLLLGRLVDTAQRATEANAVPDQVSQAIAGLLTLIGGAYLLREALNVLRRYLVENTCTRINRDMSVQLVEHLIQTDLAVLGREKVGALHGRILRSVDGLVRFLRLSFLDFIPTIITGLFALAAAASKHWLLGLVMLGVMPLAVWLTVRQLISQKDVRLSLLRNCEEIDGTVVEQLGGIEYVRAAHTEEQEVQRLARATEERRCKEVRHHFVMSLFGGGKALNEAFFHIVVLALGVYLAMRGQISFGDVLTFSILFLSVMSPLSEIHRLLDEGHESSLRVGDLLALLAQPKDRSFAVKAVGTPQLVPGEPALVIEDLAVDYTMAEGECVHALDGMSLTIRHGETIGVAGRSGCGKSTWIKVLLRLVHPSGGRVVLGGVALEHIDRAELARLIGYVGQAPFVFSGTVAENIAYGNDHAAPDDVCRAAERAHIHDEIMALPGGYEARIAERGQNLSGGQRQRLALARVLLKKPPILILDEATSALDNISERHVQRELGVTDRQRTTILVAHRLSTLRDADRIVVFDGGRIAEVGAYDELVERGGAFTELVRSAETGVDGQLIGVGR